LLAHPAPEGINAELAPWNERWTEGRLLGGQTEQVSGDAHLAIATFASTDANDGNGEQLPKLCRELRRDVLKNHGEATHGLQLESLAFEFVLALGIESLTPVAEAMHRLRGETEVPHHGYAHAHEPVDHRENLGLCTLELHGRGARLLQQRACGGNGPIDPALIAEKGQVHDHQRLVGDRSLESAAHRLAVQQHLFEGHRKGGGVTQHHHGQGVAHQHHVSAGFLHQGR